jgi:low temperature requirement protein LtrA
VAGCPAGGEYLADRYRSLFVIGLGEVILAIGSTLTGRGFALDRTIAFVVTFAITALTWRLYVFRAGEDVGLAIRASANPEVLGTLVGYAHLAMLYGLVVASVGAQLVIDEPRGQARTSSTVTILGGAALFLVARIVLQYLVFTSVSASRFVGLLVLACLLPPLLVAPPLITAIATGVVFTGIVVADNRRVRRQPAPISPAGPRAGELKETTSLDPALWEKFAEAAGDRDRAALLSEFVKWFVDQPGAKLPPRA